MPTLRAMEIIDELEPHVRHVYTGAIGDPGTCNMDSNVAIVIVGAWELLLFFRRRRDRLRF